MAMLFFLANCILKVDIFRSPDYVTQAKRKSLFSTISPGEIFETFVEFDDNLTIGNDSYTK